MRNIIFAIGSILLLAGCVATTDNKFKSNSTVRVINTTSYPEFPDIQPIAPLNLIPWNHDVPRDMSRLTVKNISTCVDVPEDKRNDSFWRKCGENPIVTNSNIFVGFDQQNWNIILEDFAKLREAIFQYKQRLDAVNKQRRSWRRKAEEERKKAKALNFSEGTSTKSSASKSSKPSSNSSNSYKEKDGGFGVKSENAGS